MRLELVQKDARGLCANCREPLDVKERTVVIQNRYKEQKVDIRLHNECAAMCLYLKYHQSGEE